MRWFLRRLRQATPAATLVQCSMKGHQSPRQPSTCSCQVCHWTMKHTHTPTFHDSSALVYSPKLMCRLCGCQSWIEWERGGERRGRKMYFMVCMFQFVIHWKCNPGGFLLGLDNLSIRNHHFLFSSVFLGWVVEELLAQMSCPCGRVWEFPFDWLSH